MNTTLGRSLLNSCDAALMITILLAAPTRVLDLLPAKEIVIGMGFSFVAAVVAIWMTALHYSRASIPSVK